MVKTMDGSEIRYCVNFLGLFQIIDKKMVFNVYSNPKNKSWKKETRTASKYLPSMALTLNSQNKLIWTPRWNVGTSH